MAWKKWIIRGLAFLGFALLSLTGLSWRLVKDADFVRRQVLARLDEDFLGVHASLNSARFRLFRGIEVKELRLARKDDLDRADFAYLPLAILYHDKELLLKKKLRLRKIELHSPRLRLVRKPDGQWNVAGILGPSKTDEPVPTLVVRNGTLTIEDRTVSPPAIAEFKQVLLTVLNDPLPTLVFDGHATSELTGAIRLRGQMNRSSGALDFQIEAAALPVGPALLKRLSAFCPQVGEQAQGLRAKLQVRLTLNRGHRDQPFRHCLTGSIREGEFSHPRLPETLTGLEGDFSVADGSLGRVDLRGRAGKTGVRLTLREAMLPPGPCFLDSVREMELHLTDLVLTTEVLDKLPAELQGLRWDYSPGGKTDVTLSCRRLGEGRWRKSLELRPTDGTGCFHAFPVPVEKIRGKITYSATLKAQPRSESSPCSALEAPVVEDERLTVDVTGVVGGKEGRLVGEIQGCLRSGELRFDLGIDGVALDQQLLDALPEKPRKAALAFQPSGTLDVRAFLRRPAGAKELKQLYEIHLREGSICYEAFPLTMTRVSASLEATPTSWVLRELIGHHGGGRFVIRARGEETTAPVTSQVRLTTPYAAQLPRKTERVRVHVEARDIPLDDAFSRALGHGREKLAKTWKLFQLTGKLSFNATIDDVPERPQDIEIQVAVNGCRMRPAFFTYAMEDVSARLHYARGTVEVTGFRARHGESVLSFERAVTQLKPDGGYWSRLEGVRGQPLVIDGDLLEALPAPLRKTAQALELRGPIGLDTLIVLDGSPESLQPVLYWDGSLRFQGARVRVGVPVTGVTGVVSARGLHNGRQLEDVVGNVLLERATVFNQPLRDIHVPLLIWKNSPDVLRMPDMKARLHGGWVGGEARVEFGSIFRYELLVKASQVRLEEFGRHNLGAADLSGLAFAGLHLAGEGLDGGMLRGSGRIDVPSGKMYRLPLLLDLLKWLGLRLPDRTAFEQAHATFGIDGDRVNVTRLDLYGNAISIRGQGSLRLDGSDLNLDLNADWGRLSQLLPSAVNNLTRELSNQLLRIKVRGKVGALKFEQELVPIVTDPLRKMIKGMTPEGR